MNNVHKQWRDGMPDVDALLQPTRFQDGTARVLALARAQATHDCATLGQLHACHAQLLSRKADPAVAAELLALGDAIGRAVGLLAIRNADIARLRQAAI